MFYFETFDKALNNNISHEVIFKIIDLWFVIHKLFFVLRSNSLSNLTAYFSLITSNQNIIFNVMFFTPCEITYLAQSNDLKCCFFKYLVNPLLQASTDWNTTPAIHVNVTKLSLDLGYILIAVNQPQLLDQSLGSNIRFRLQCVED